MTTVLYVFLGIIAAAVFIDAIGRRRIRTLRQSGIYPAPGQGTGGDVERLVALGRKLDAIKLYREIHRTDLKTAKQAVDELAERPELRERR
jgi:ribosomal protein L7/L12